VGGFAGGREFSSMAEESTVKEKTGVVEDFGAAYGCGCKNQFSWGILGGRIL